MVAQWRLAERQGGPIGIGGVFGVLDRRVPFDAIGRVVHRDRLLEHRALPADVNGLDELLMVVPEGIAVACRRARWGGTSTAPISRCRPHELGLRVVVRRRALPPQFADGPGPVEVPRERARPGPQVGEAPPHPHQPVVDRGLVDRRDRVRRRADRPRAERLGRAGIGAGRDSGARGLRLRREQAALNTELEQARLQVASMQASPFWRARQVYAAVRDRLWQRR